MRNIELSVFFWSFLVFNLMVLFVRAANNGKVTHGKTPRIFYIFSTLLHYSGSSWNLLRVMRKISIKIMYNRLAIIIYIFSHKQNML